MDSGLIRVLLFGLWLLGAQQPSVPSPTADLSIAKSLYVGADYDGALRVLSTIDADEADVYRALCLLALSRRVEGEAQLQALVTRNPLFRLTDAAPRFMALFDDTRKRLLPRIISERYLAARARYEEKHYEEAATAFSALLLLLDDAASRGAETSSVGELRLPAEGFLKLAEAALAEAAEKAATARTSAMSSSVAVAAAAGNTVDPRKVARDVERSAIRSVIQQYVHGYSTLDGQAVAALIQNSNPRMFQAAFDGLKSQAVEVRDILVALDDEGRSAAVTLTWAVEAVPRVGRPTKTRTTARLQLVKSERETWIIVERC